MRLSFLPACLLLTACGAGSDALVFDTASLVMSDVGAVSGEPATNGLAYATGEDGVTTLGGATFTTRMIRIVRDVDTEHFVIRLTEEEVTPASDYFTAYNRDVAFTLDGEMWETGLREDNMDATFLQTFLPKNVAEVSIYDLDTSADEIVHWGFATFGSETDPASMPTGTINVDYAGTMKLVAFPYVDGATTPSAFSTVLFLDLEMSHDLSANTVDGSFDGFYSADGGALQRDVWGVVHPGAVTGNGYASTFEITGCEDTITCAGDGELAGVFYDADAGVLTGLVQGDIQIGNLNIYGDVHQDHDLDVIGYFWVEK